MKRKDVPFYHDALPLAARRGMTCRHCGRPLPKHFFRVTTALDQRLEAKAAGFNDDPNPALCSWFCTKSWVIEAINQYERDEE